MYPFEKPALMGKEARWLLLFTEFNLKFIPRKPVKEDWQQNSCQTSRYKERKIKNLNANYRRNQAALLWQSTELEQTWCKNSYISV